MTTVTDGARMPMSLRYLHLASSMDMTGELIKQYATFMHRKGLCDATINRRGRVLEVVDEQHGLLSVTSEQLETLLDSRTGRHGGLDAKTRSAWVSHLHNFYQWAIAFEHVTIDPTARMIRPKLRRRLPRPIPEQAFLAAVDSAPTELLKAWLLLAGNAGLRCCEIAGLLGENVADGYLRVIGKGDKERAIPIHPKLGELIDSWPKSGPVFVDQATGTSYRPAQVSKLIGDYFRRNQLPYRAHQARHRFASAVYAQTGDISVVAELCGHESIETTRIYTQVSSKRRSEAVSLIS